MNFIFPVSGTDGNGLVESAAIGKFRMSGNSTGPLKRATKKKKALKYFQTTFSLYKRKKSQCIYLSRCQHFWSVLEENASLGFISVSIAKPNKRTVLIEDNKFLPPGLSKKSF